MTDTSKTAKIKKMISLTSTLPNCQCDQYQLFMIFAVFKVSVIAYRR